MDENIQQVLRLLQEGKITATEAESLISALQGRPAAAPRPAAPAPPEPAPAPPPPSNPGYSPPNAHYPPPAPEYPTPDIPRPTPAPERSAAANLFPTGDLLFQIADDPSIAEGDKLTLIMHATALICTVVALQPIPGADVFLLTPILVASVMAMSHVMGQPIGKNGAGEIVASVIGVVGLGVIAEQFVLAGAKILLPFFGGVTLIPLVYAATCGLVATAWAVLDARRSNRSLSDSELRRIKEEAERRAKAEKRDWSLAGLKSELDGWIARGESYKRFEADYTALQQQQETSKPDLERLSREAFEWTQRKLELAQRLQEARKRYDAAESDSEAQTEAAKEVEALQAQTEAAASAESEKVKELERKASAVESPTTRLTALVQERFRTAYPDVTFTKAALAALVEAPYPRFHEAERQISLLQFDPTRAAYRDETFFDAAAAPIRVVTFDDDGRLYLSTTEQGVLVRAAGSRRTEDRDIARLKTAV